ncbi:MAG TPA: Ig-like domain-containing protein [Polyangia bacterium]|jgi:hypothetical protein
MVSVEMTESAATAADAGTSAAAPAVIYLAYADGTALPTTNPNACVGIAPRFNCTFASTLKDCQRQIQTYLDRWYADFNVVFTLTRPTSGPFYTEVVSSGGGGWCNASATTAGIAPFYCKDLAGGVAYTFMGGQAAKETAIIIAQEQAHLVGLEHTKSTQDVMDPTICPNCDGFQNVVNQVDGDRCGRATQNSYQMMLGDLGAWPGGVKPTPFGCDPDTAAPSVSIVSPANQARVTSSFQLTARATDDCAVKTVSVKVSPMGLQTSSSAPPFTWTLTRITGQQTITVTATDASGKSSSASVVVNAPGSDGGVADAGATDGKTTDAKTMVAGDAAGGDGGTAEVNGGQAGGCAIAGGPGTGFVASAAVALALLLAWAHRRRSVAQRVRPRRTDRRR